MHAHPVCAGGGVHERVQDRPVRDRVGAVEHALGLAVGARHAAGVEVVAPDHDRRAHGAGGHELVEPLARSIALAVAEPADARRQPLVSDPLGREPEPPLQALVIREHGAHSLVGGRDVGGIARERRPPERPLALAEHRANERRHEPRVAEGDIVVEPAGFRAGSQVVAVVERHGSSPGEAHDGLDVGSHRRLGTPHVLGRIPGPQLRRLGEREPCRHVAAEWVVGAGLVGDDVGLPATSEQLGQHVGAVAHESDGDPIARSPRLVCPPHGGVEVVGRSVEIAGLDAPLDARWVDLDTERDAVVHRHGERLGAAHAAEATRERDRPSERRSGSLTRALRERLVGALQDALGSDVDPRSRGHLSVHREPLRLQRAERLPIGPSRHQHRVRDQHPRRHVVRAEDRDRFARLHEQRLVVLQRPEGSHDRVVGVPAARRPSGAAVDDEVVRSLGDVGVEVVHQHAHRGFLRPRTAREVAATRRANLPGAHRRHLRFRRDATAAAIPAPRAIAARQHVPARMLEPDTPAR